MIVRWILLRKHFPKKWSLRPCSFQGGALEGSCASGFGTCCVVRLGGLLFLNCFLEVCCFWTVFGGLLFLNCVWRFAVFELFLEVLAILLFCACDWRPRCFVIMILFTYKFGLGQGAGGGGVCGGVVTANTTVLQVYMSFLLQQSVSIWQKDKIRTKLRQNGP